MLQQCAIAISTISCESKKIVRFNEISKRHRTWRLQMFQGTFIGRIISETQSFSQMRRSFCWLYARCREPRSHGTNWKQKPEQSPEKVMGHAICKPLYRDFFSLVRNYQLYIYYLIQMLKRLIWERALVFWFKFDFGYQLPPIWRLNHPIIPEIIQVHFRIMRNSLEYKLL